MGSTGRRELNSAAECTSIRLPAGSAGVFAGLALSAYAHTANGFLTGPDIMLGLVIAIVGVPVAAVLLMIGKCNDSVYGLAWFCLAMLCALVLLPLFWPYPNSGKPIPLSSIP